MSNSTTEIVTSETDESVVDIWTTEKFEEEVSSSLISLYESKLVHQRHNHPRMRLTDSDLTKARKLGVYIPEPNRLIFLDAVDELYTLPDVATSTMSWVGKQEQDNTNMPGYRCNIMLEKVNNLPRGFKRLGGGQLYKLSAMVAQETGGVDGHVSYVSVDKHGNVYNTDFSYNNNTRTRHEPKLLAQEKHAATYALNYWTDKVNTWSIVAQESEAKCEVGVEVEQIKSLLYARTLPVTSTGRKRPILHLVASHRRRMKEGIDIDISQYLRGIEKVEIGGTIFTVKPAEILKLKK